MIHEVIGREFQLIVLQLLQLVDYVELYIYSNTYFTWSVVNQSYYVFLLHGLEYQLYKLK